MKKRSVRIAGHATSISLEDDFWTALKDLATADGVTLNDLIARIDAEKKGANLSSALRLHVLRMIQQAGPPPEISLREPDGPRTPDEA